MKKLLACIISLCIIFSFQCVIFASQTGTTFTDVDANSAVGKDIYKLYNAGIINGNGDGTFAPQNPVTRAELCKMVNNIRGYKTPSQAGFSDLTTDKWYYDHVLIGKQAGYINGFPDGTFRGDDHITREQVCAIVCRAFGVYDLGISADVKDAVSEWALPYVNALVTNKLVSLESGNTFRATENMKRGELATVLAKFVVDKPVVTPPSTGGSTGGNSGGSVIKPGGNTGGSIGGNTSTTKPENPGSGTTEPETPGSGTTEPENPGSGTTEPETPGSGTTEPENPGSGTTEPENPGSGTTEPENPGSGTTEPENPGSGTTEPENPGSGTTEPENPGSGTTEPEEPEEMTKEEIIAANGEVLTYLKAVLTDLTNARFTGRNKTIVNIVKSCLTDAIAVGEKGEELISKDYVYERYDNRIREAKDIYYGMSEEAQAAFIDAVSKEVSEETQDYLLMMFL